MNLKEANVMRGQLVELRLKLQALENRVQLVEDSLATPEPIQKPDSVFHVKRGRPRKVDGEANR